MGVKDIEICQWCQGMGYHPTARYNLTCEWCDGTGWIFSENGKQIEAADMFPPGDTAYAPYDTDAIARTLESTAKVPYQPERVTLEGDES